MKWEKTHPSKVAVAEQLAEAGHLKTDVGQRVAELNELRKDVQYGEPGPGLRELELEDLATELENFVDEAAEFVDSQST